MKTSGLLLAMIAVCVYASPPADKKRKFHKDFSDVEHDVNGEHNVEYDHEAFLGHDEKLKFDEMDPEESKRQLEIIFTKIDKDEDGVVNGEEMKEWIQQVHKRYILNETENAWKEHNPEKDGRLSWPEYQKRAYSYDDDPNEPGSRTEQHAERINRDRRRWDMADLDKDGFLTKDEFRGYLHPEDAEHMKDIVIHETIEDMDKDKDGFVDLNEYIGDLWTADGEHDEEPDWLQDERKQFTEQKDKDKDGKMSFKEVKAWLMPDDFDDAAAESQHLISETDQNEDGKLTKEEMLDKYDLFVGSHAENFGHGIGEHDEF